MTPDMHNSDPNKRPTRSPATLIPIFLGLVGSGVAFLVSAHWLSREVAGTVALVAYFVLFLLGRRVFAGTRGGR
jgi:hypothetical protein